MRAKGTNYILLLRETAMHSFLKSFKRVFLESSTLQKSLYLSLLMIMKTCVRVAAIFCKVLLIHLCSTYVSNPEVPSENFFNLWPLHLSAHCFDNEISCDVCLQNKCDHKFYDHTCNCHVY